MGFPFIDFISTHCFFELIFQSLQERIAYSLIRFFAIFISIKENLLNNFTGIIC